MPIDYTAAGLNGDGIIDTSPFPNFNSVTWELTTLGPSVRHPSSDLEEVNGAGYFEVGFAAAAPWSADFWNPFSFWINVEHAWWDVLGYPTLAAGNWDKLRYHLSPGTIGTIWLTH